MENLNIALVHEWITNVAGSERVLLVLKEIFPEAPIYTAVFDPKRAKAFEKFDVRTSFLQKIPLLKRKRELLIPLTPFAFEQFDLSAYDLVISSTTMAAKGVITKPDTIHISYCHTPPRYLWEPDIDPRAQKGHFRWWRSNVIHKMRIWDRVAVDRVDGFIANSQYVARRIEKFYGKYAPVVYPAVNTEHFTPGRSDKIKDYFLYVSRLVDYKRCDIVIEAFNELGLPLKVIGRGPQRKKLMSMANDNIEFLGYLSDEEIKKCYQEARAFVFAAEEDFGIVPVEAMACGRPVIAYSKGGVAETVIDGVTGAFFHSQTSESLVDVIKKFDHTKYDCETIRSHALNFSKERFEKALINQLESYIKNINQRRKEK